MELNQRFSDDSKTIMNGISALTLSSNNFLHNDFLSEFAKRFNISSTDVKHKISLVRKLVNDNTLTVAQFLIELFPYKKAFEGIYRLLLLAVTLPVTSASCERSFSKMKIVKTFLRNSMSNNRLSNIALLILEGKGNFAEFRLNFILIFPDFPRLFLG